MSCQQKAKWSIDCACCAGEEAFGEDPMLISLMGVAAVTGLSGPGKAGAASTYIDRPDIHIATEVDSFIPKNF